MSKADVEIVIGARDDATKVLNSVAHSVEDRVKRIRDVGGRAKASTEFVGAIASSLGGTEIGSAAGQIAGLTDKVSAFAEVAKGGGAAATLAKAGVVGLVAAASLKIGYEIGAWASDTRRFVEETKAAVAASRELNTELVKTANKRAAFAIEEIRLIQDPGRQREELKSLLASTETELTQWRSRVESKAKIELSWFRLDDWRAFMNASEKRNDTDFESKQLEAAKQRFEILKGETDERRLAIEEQRKHIATMDAGRKLLEGVKRENELLFASEKDRFALQLQQQVGQDQYLQRQALLLIQEREAILAKQEAEKAAADESKRIADERVKEADRIRGIQESELKRLKEQEVLITQGAEAAKTFSLIQQGLDRNVAKQIAAEEARIERLQEQKALAERASQSEKDRREIALQPAGNLQATQGRLLTRGNNESVQERIAKFAETQTKLLERLIDNTKPRPPQMQSRKVLSV